MTDTYPMTLRVQEKLQQKGMLLCSHCVLGYPRLEDNPAAVKAFTAAGADIMELQIPFSDPTADGPLLMHANQEALAGGISVEDCLQQAAKIVASCPDTIFVFMTYYNIIYQQGIDGFAQRARQMGVDGVIVPDLPFEEAGEWLEACAKHRLAPVLLVTPETAASRLEAIAAASQGFVYCVARKGITGKQTRFGEAFAAYIARVRAATNLPIGVGFGIRTPDDIQQLRGKTDIAIVCSKAIEILGNEGHEQAAQFIASLVEHDTSCR